MMSRTLHSRADENDATLVAGNCALYEHQVSVFDNFYENNVLYCNGVSSCSSRSFVTLEYS